MDEQQTSLPIKRKRGRWVKGQSGNAGGRTSRFQDLYSLAQKCKEKDFDPFSFFIDVAKDDKNEMPVRVSAAKEVASRLLPTLKAVEVSQDDETKKDMAALREKMKLLLVKHTQDH